MDDRANFTQSETDLEFFTRKSIWIWIIEKIDLIDPDCKTTE